jgi:hypothetical protein
MMTMMIVSYISSWIVFVYEILTAKMDVELWGEEIE